MAGNAATGDVEWMRLGRRLAEDIRKRRKAAGLSQPRLAERIGYTPQYVSLAERPNRGLPSDALVQALDHALGADGALVALRDQAGAARKACRPGSSSSTMTKDANPTGPGPGQPPAPLGEVKNSKRRELITAAVVAPDLLNRVLAEAAAEAMEFTRLTGVSSVGSGTLEHLELVITDLNRGYSHEPPAELFAVALAYRSRVDDLIQGRHTLKELQDLYVNAGCLSELLAWLAHDLGNPRAARAYAVDSYAHAEQAGHGELCGWAADAMTAIATYAEQPGGAVQAAMKGLAQVPRGHPLAIRLRAKAARACARLGDRERFESLFAEARRLHDQMPTQTPIRFTLNTGAQASYAITAHPAQAYLWLEDFHAAKRYGEAALAIHESAPPGGSSTGRGAMVRLVLATALTHLGTPDEAVALGNEALTSSVCAANFVRAHARDLDVALVSRYPALTCVRDFHEQHRHVLRS